MTRTEIIMDFSLLRKKERIEGLQETSRPLGEGGDLHFREEIMTRLNRQTHS